MNRLPETPKTKHDSSKHLDSEIASVLGPDGALSEIIPGFAPRHGQLKLADAVASTLRTGELLIAEAGTGIGKTFAYLVPAMLSGQRVLVSTGTRHLQDQICQQDIPRLQTALGVSLRVQLLKGRSNYYCPHRAEQFVPQHRKEADKIHAVRMWSTQTESGDLAELSDLRESDPIRSRITSTAENCLGNQCPEYEGCFVAKARARAQEADLVVVNHHLLCADLALKEEGFGELLPRMDAVIIDEAHQFPQILAQFFGFGVSARQCKDLGRDIIDAVDAFGDMPRLKDLVAALGTALQGMQECFPFSRSRLELDQLMTDRQFLVELDAITDIAEQLDKQLEEVANRGPDLAAVWRRASQLHQRLRRWQQLGQREDSASEDELVRWGERQQNGFTLQAIPMDVAPAMSTARGRQDGAWVLTSATLSVAGDFGHFGHRLGLLDAHCLQVDSPFDYANKARLYLPQGLPAPNDRTYPAALLDLGKRLINASSGGCFWLCTSQRAVEEYAYKLRKWGQCVVLEQGEEERSQLLQRFREDGHAVLVGTSSFWEGVDVRGAALRLVIIDRLPFASPDDPMVKARTVQVQRDGGNAFFDYQVPQAVLTLKQGAGRLIRDVNDRGVLVLGDKRIQTMRYGQYFLDSIPPMRRSQDEREISDFLAGIRL